MELSVQVTTKLGHGLNCNQIGAKIQALQILLCSLAEIEHMEWENIWMEFLKQLTESSWAALPVNMSADILGTEAWHGKLTLTPEMPALLQGAGAGPAGPCRSCRRVLCWGKSRCVLPRRPCREQAASRVSSEAVTSSFAGCSVSSRK